jgi:hypothetical protein
VGHEVAFDQQWNAHICHLDNATRPPYWVPAQVVAVAADAGGSLIKPVDVTVDPAQVIAAAVPANVKSWDTGHGAIEVTANQPGYLFIDRAWWPAWQMTLDGEAVTPLRALGGQLIRLPAGNHVVEEHLFLVDVLLGAVVSAATLTILAAWFVRARRRYAPAVPPDASAQIRDGRIRGAGTAFPSTH